MWFIEEMENFEGNIKEWEEFWGSTRWNPHGRGEKL